MATDVSYGEFAVADEMPEGAGRTSPLYGLVRDITADEDKWKKAICIAHYGDKQPASGAANQLRAKFGRKIEDDGLTFAVRLVNVKKGGETTERHGLWVYYDPSKIVPGEMEKHVANERAKARKQAEKVKAKAAEKRAVAAA
jgi:hypothetical protein